MIIPDSQVWTLHHIGHAYYWVLWRVANGVFVSSAWLVGESWAERNGVVG